MVQVRREEMSDPPNPQTMTIQAIVPTAASPLYRLGQVLAIFSTLLVPLCYFGLVSAIVYFMHWHVVEHSEWLKNRSATGRRFLVFAYFMAIIAPSLLLLLLLKPLFARRIKPTRRILVEPAQEAVLFQFLNRIADAVGSPRPARVLISTEVNASAGFHESSLGLTSRQRELHLGLPLVAGLSRAELAGVIAHEFGHFSQGLGTRLNNLLRLANAIIDRVSSRQDDAIDRWLQQTRKAADVGYVVFPVMALQSLIWLTRRVLAGVGWLGRVVSSFFSRQMEYDADRFAIEFIGSGPFIATHWKTCELSAARQFSWSMITENLRSNVLPDDFVALIRHQEAQLTDQQKMIIRKLTTEGPQPRFSTHPRDIDRTTAAEALNRPAKFQCDEPASDLFADFSGLCRKATRQFYEECGVLGESGVRLVSLAAYLNAAREVTAESAAISTLSLGVVHGHRPVISESFESWSKTTSPDPQAAQAAFAAARSAGVEIFDTWTNARDRTYRISLAQNFTAAKIPFDPSPLQLDPAEAELEICRQHEEETIARSQRQLEAIDRQFERYFVALLQLPAIEPDHAAKTQKLAEIWDDVWFLDTLLPEAAACDIRLGQLDVLLQNLELSRERRAADSLVERLTTTLRDHLEHVLLAIKNRELFDPGSELRTAAHGLLFRASTDKLDMAATLAAARSFVDRFYYYRYRSLGVLARMAQTRAAAHFLRLGNEHAITEVSSERSTE